MTGSRSTRAMLTTLGLALCSLAAGCVGSGTGATASSTPTGAAYRVTWAAVRAADGAPLRSSSVVVRSGQTVNARTDSTQPDEDKPAFPNYTVGLSPARNTGVHELYLRVGLQEVIRSRKGKLRRKKRNIGALVPIRVGETQQVSSTSDLIRMDVRLERQ